MKKILAFNPIDVFNGNTGALGEKESLRNISETERPTKFLNPEVVAKIVTVNKVLGKGQYGLIATERIQVGNAMPFGGTVMPISNKPEERKDCFQISNKYIVDPKKAPKKDINQKKCETMFYANYAPLSKTRKLMQIMGLIETSMQNKRTLNMGDANTVFDILEYNKHAIPCLRAVKDIPKGSPIIVKQKETLVAINPNEVLARTILVGIPIGILYSVVNFNIIHNAIDTSMVVLISAAFILNQIQNQHP